MIFTKLINRVNHLETLWQHYSAIYNKNKADPDPDLVRQMSQIAKDLVAAQTEIVAISQCYNFRSLVDTPRKIYMYDQEGDDE